MFVEVFNMKCTAIANSNIAIVKYWGKRNYELNLPTNDSISFTMDDQLQTKTTVEFDKKLKTDEFVLDGKVATKKECARVRTFLDIVRKMARIKESARVVSNNSFPKSAGLASSASGFAALAGAASKAAELDLSMKSLSILARCGSGSASRSIFGGAVEWFAGINRDGSDSYARQLSPPEKWKDLRNIIAIVSEEEKKVSSIEGMRLLKTSKRFKQRLIDVEKRLEIVRATVRNCDFSVMPRVIMEDSDDMHAVMADCTPSVVYMNEISHEIRNKVIEFNEKNGFSNPLAAYTFDAGPNAHVYTTTKYSKEIEKMLKEIDGVKRVLVCGIGKGIGFSNAHLF